MSSLAALLTDAPRGQHFCQLHRSSEDLDAALLGYLDAGIRQGDTAAVFASPARLERVRIQLEKIGTKVEKLESGGRLALLDGSELLQRFVNRATPDWNGFRAAVCEVIEPMAAASAQRLRLYGDMVDDLWRAGHTAETIHLEQVWNDLRRDHDFCLFCGYELDSLDADAYRGPVDEIGHVHATVAATAEDSAALEALDRACRELLGFPLSGLVNHSASKTSPGERQLPLARRVVLWLKRNMPSAAEDVLERARTFHEEAERLPA